MNIAAVIGLVLGATAARAGTVSGTVTLKGTPPPKRQMEAHHDSQVCGAKTPMMSQDFRVGGKGGLAGVVVIVTGVPGAKPVAKKGLLEQRNCTFLPHVQSLSLGSTLTITNDDPILHNVHAYIEDRTVFNLAMPVKGVRIQRKLNEAGVVAIRCDSGHTWMSAYIAVVPHTFHATTNKNGRFSIQGLPAGTFKASAWHPKLGTKQGSVTVSGSGEGTLNFSFDAPVITGNESSAQEEEAGHAAMADMVTPDVLDTKIGEIEDVIYNEVDAVKEKLDQTIVRLRVEERRRVLGQGRSLYLRHCATCHGTEGDGYGPNAKFLDIPPRDFTRGEYQFRMTPSGTLAREDDLYRTITVGVLGTPMPPWQKVLTKDQRRLLARYIMALSPRYLEDEPGEAIQIPAAPENNAESVAKGKKIYADMKCAQCHGEEGRGDGTSADTTKDDWGNPIAPYDFTKGYFQGGRGGAVVYRAIATGLSGSPMPSYADVLAEEDRWHLVHYILTMSEENALIDYFLAPAGRISTP